MNKYLKSNRDWWDKATALHLNSKLYGVEDFKNGKTNLSKVYLFLAI